MVVFVLFVSSSRALHPSWLRIECLAKESASFSLVAMFVVVSNLVPALWAVESVASSFSAVTQACCLVVAESWAYSFSAVAFVLLVCVDLCCVLCLGSFPTRTCGELPLGVIFRPARTQRYDPCLLEPLRRRSYGL